MRPRYHSIKHSFIYKIASGVISMRLKTILDKLICKDQAGLKSRIPMKHTGFQDKTGFLKGIYIEENTRLIYDIMDITEEMYAW